MKLLGRKKPIVARLPARPLALRPRNSLVVGENQPVVVSASVPLRIDPERVEAAAMAAWMALPPFFKTENPACEAR